MDSSVNPATPATPAPASEVKFCCAAAYQTEWATLLLGNSFHPGGAALTRRLGEALGLAPGMRVLDVASGKGSSAIMLAQTFGCSVLGVDYGDESVRAASAAAEQAGVAALVRFEQGDAERLPVADGSFDALVCECAFCTFPDKRTAAAEFTRVLRPGGGVGLSDLTRHRAEIPADLRGLLAWIACIADAQPVAEYVRYLTQAGLTVTLVEPHDDALGAMVHDIRTKLMGAELLFKLKQVELPNIDFEQARALARAAAEAVRARQFG
ncbi:MAG: class I SAM-dependent methyltransferase, partial [Ktedonobacterales bacterium]